MIMHTSSPKTSLSFWVLSLGLIGLGAYSLVSLDQSAALYDNEIAMQAAQSNGSVKKVEFPGTSTPLNIPDWSLLRAGHIWSLTSKSHPLPAGYTSPPLVNTSVAHGDSARPMQVQVVIEPPLKRLVAAAQADGIELMLSSGYRSVADQQKLYDSFVAKQGKAMADLYVAKPGTSEHHTGLAIDFATASAACQADSDKCSLSVAAAEWLVENGPKYGFVQRYAEGKQPLTGVAYEPWHYRYLGVPMARAIAASSLTYDEAVKQIAPGYSK